MEVRRSLSSGSFSSICLGQLISARDRYAVGVEAYPAEKPFRRRRDHIVVPEHERSVENLPNEIGSSSFKRCLSSNEHCIQT